MFRYQDTRNTLLDSVLCSTYCPSMYVTRDLWPGVVHRGPMYTSGERSIISTKKRGATKTEALALR